MLFIKWENMELVFIELLIHPIKEISKVENIMHQGWKEIKCFTIDQLALLESTSHDTIEDFKSWDGRVDWQIKTWFASPKDVNTNLPCDMGNLLEKLTRLKLTSQELDSLWLISSTKSPWPKIWWGIATTLQESFLGGSWMTIWT